MAAQTKISIYRDNTPTISFPVTVNSVAPDLTGYTAYFTVTSDSNPTSNSDDAFQIRLNPIPNATTGVVNFTLTNAQTAPLNPQTSYYWHFSLKDASGNIFTILTGPFIVQTNYNRSFN